MHIAALVKQVRGPDGSDLEMETASRRAVAQAVELAAAVGDGECTIITVAGADGDGALREGIAWASSCSVIADGVRVELEGDAPDPLAIAEAVAKTAARDSRFDLLLLGDASPESGGLLAPTLAELLDYPFLGPAAFLSLQGEALHVRCHRGDDWLQATVSLPVVISCAMDLIPPCEVPAGVRATVPATRLRIERANVAERAPAPSGARTTIGVVVEPDHPETRASLVDEALKLAAAHDREVVVLECEGGDVAEDAARSVADWCVAHGATTLVGSTSAWGQEVVGRTSARLAPTPIESVVITPTGSTKEPNDAGVTVESIAVRRRGRLRVVSRPRRR